MAAVYPAGPEPMMMTSRTSVTACASLQDLPTPQPILGSGDSRLALERHLRDDVGVRRRAAGSHHPRLTRDRDDVRGLPVVGGLVHQRRHDAVGALRHAPLQPGRWLVETAAGRAPGGGR